MTRRLLLALALLAFAAPAHALGTGKLLIVYDDNPNICRQNCTPDDQAYVDSVYRAAQGMVRRGWSNLTYLLDRNGVNYKVAPVDYVLTEEARIGAVTWNRGTSAATTETFDAVLHFPFDANQPKTSGITCRADSLWRAARHNTAVAATNGQSVPAGFILRPVTAGRSIWDSGTQGQAAPVFSSNATSSATRCSLGVQGLMDGGLGYQDAGAGAVPSLSRSPKTGRVWFSSANLPSFYVHPDATTHGTLVPLVQTFYYTTSRVLATARAGAQTLRPDSLLLDGYGYDVAPTSADTLNFASVWERRYNAGAAATNGTSVFGYPVNVCATYWGAAACSDTIGAGPSGAATGPACEGAPENLLFVLARLDSLTGGALFDRSTAPIVAAPVVYGGFSRASRRHYYGLAPSDTTTLWNTLDSLRAEGIPLTVAANMDSIQTYASEIAQWKKAQVKFVPWSRSGQSATTAGTVASPTAYRDLWGRVRSRMIYGDAGTWGAANDTSLRALYRYAVDTLKKQVGINYVTTNAAVALDDDWSPTNAATISNFTDSLVYTLNSLGIRSLVIDGQVRDLYKVAAASRIGWGMPDQGPLRTSNPPGSLMLLAHTGFSISGGAIQNDYGADSTTWVESTCCNGFSTATATNKAVNRWITGLLGPNDYKDYDYFPHDGKSTSYAAYAYAGVNVSFNDYLWPFRRAVVLRMGPNDLAGSTTAPVRPAYFALKGLNNMFTALNGMSYGNKPLIRLGLLEEANP